MTAPAKEIQAIEELLHDKATEEWATVRAILEVEHEREITEQLTKSIDRTQAEKDLRWSRVSDSTPVRFDDEMTTWGKLSQAERMSCEFTPQGDLEGGLPF